VGEKLTKAQEALLRLMEVHGQRAVFGRTPQEKADIRRCVRAGLLVSAGWETTVAAEDWMNYRLPKEPARG